MKEKKMKKKKMVSSLFKKEKKLKKNKNGEYAFRKKKLMKKRKGECTLEWSLFDYFILASPA